MKVGLIIPWTLVQHCSGYSQTKECSSLITLRGDSFRLSCRHGDGNAQAASAATGILEEARRRGLNIHGQYVLTERERREAEESIKTILANDSDAEHATVLDGCLSAAALGIEKTPDPQMLRCKFPVTRLSGPN